ncbi:small ribosomal subunit protein uS19-like [Callospermophilus lateralis]
MVEVERKKKQTFGKFTYRGVDLHQLLDPGLHQKRTPAKAPAQGANLGETRGGGDTPAGHGHFAQDRGLRGWCFPWLDLPPGGDDGHHLGKFSYHPQPMKLGLPGTGATRSSPFILLN